MKRLIGVVLVSGALAAALPACQPLPSGEEGRAQGKGPLAVEPITTPDAIPASYGRPFSVTQHPTDPTIVYIWFVRDDQSIVAVRVDHNTVLDATTIPRR
jgi:hypothetical protein